jgi:hypothetical protein
MPEKVISVPISRQRIMILANKIRVSFFPRNLNSITIDETHTADEVSEKTIAAPGDKSV